MRRLCTAAVLFSCLIIGCLCNLWFVSHTISDLSAPLELAAQAARDGDMQRAGQLTAQAQRGYRQREGYLSAVISEKLLDEVRLGFARTVEGAGAGDDAQFIVELAGLRQAVDDLLRSERINQKNIF